MSAQRESGLFHRTFLAILAVSLIPLFILGAIALYSIAEAGATASGQSRRALDAKSARALELRAAETAQAIAGFLRDREADLRTAALLPRSPETYLEFATAHQGRLWLIEGGLEFTRTVPLYREVAFVDAAGREQIKVVDGRLAGSGELRDVSNPANTTYKSETYFSEASRLAPGELFPDGYVCVRCWASPRDLLSLFSKGSMGFLSPGCGGSPESPRPPSKRAGGPRIPERQGVPTLNADVGFRTSSPFWWWA
jgi:hypothetical protein